MEHHSPGLERLVDVRRETEELASSFGGPSGPAEGPVRWQEGGYLLFTVLVHTWVQLLRGHRRRMSPGVTTIGRRCILPPGRRYGASTRPA
jgi:hypothetical protein